MKVRLEVTHSKANVKRVVLTRNTVIGRAPECNLRIAAGQISRKHCEILVGDAGVFVRDLGSSNGTYIADKRIDPYEDFPIPPGSTLSVGGVRFVVRYELSDSNATGSGSTVNVGRPKPDQRESSEAAKPGDAPQETVAVDRDEVPSFDGVEESEPEGLPVFDDGFDDGFEESEAPAAEMQTIEGTIAEFDDGPLVEAGKEMLADDEPDFDLEGEDSTVEPAPPAPEKSSDEAVAGVEDDAVVEEAEVDSGGPSEAEVEELTFDFEAEDSNVGNSGNLANFLNNLD